MEPQKMSEASDKQKADVSLNSEPEIKESDSKNVDSIENQPEVTESENNSEMESTESTSLLDSEDIKSSQASSFVIPQSKEEIIAAFEKISEKSIDQIKDEVLQLKVAFYTIRKQEIEKEKQTFLEKGNEENAFAPMVDPLEEKLKDLLKNFKEKKAEYIANVEAQKTENLEKKNAVLNKLKEIVEDTDNINRHYNKFQQLQQEFRNIGEVPQEKVTQLWKNYQQITENFYDLLKINKDLRDYDFKKNLEAKEELCNTAEALDKDTDVVNAFKKLQDLHQQWREIGPVAPDLREEIWQKFKALSTSINKKYQAFFEVRKEKEKENEIAKTSICEKIEAMDFSNLKTYAAWEQATESIKELQEEWKKLGFASHKINIALFTRFRKTCDKFFALKAEYFKSMKESANENLSKKIALCEKAESLKDSTDWKRTANELIALQKEWKTIGPISKKHSDSIWKRFLGACDYFFEQKEKQTTNVRKEENENLDSKKSIIEALSLILEEKDSAKAISRIKDLAKQWQETGHVPFKEKDKIYNEYQTAVKKAFNKFNMHDNRARNANFEASIEQIEGDSDKLYRERDRLVRNFEQKRNELKTYETNMSFFTAKSKAGNSMLKEMEYKIAKIKEELSVIEGKIELIDSKLQ